jgi:Fuc2NAc and GlcNAc transferase
MSTQFLYLVCFVFGAGGGWVVAKFGHKIGMLDFPNQRSSHEVLTAVPKGGGIGILAAFVFAGWMLDFPLGFWLSATILALVSFYGDIFELSPKFRLLVQFSAALLFLLSTGSEHMLADLPSRSHLHPASMGLGIIMSVYIVGTANCYNFMDGINGIAGITGGISFGLLACFAFLSGNEPFLVWLSICISLACLGFLPFNMPKAKVFMGDVGSILIGFVFSSMVVWLSRDFLDFICLSAILFHFYADELTTMAVRLRDGENLTRPHRRHLYQLLANEHGISHWKISVGYGIFQLMVGFTILLLKPLGTKFILLLLVTYSAIFVLLTYRVRVRAVEVVR